MTTDIILDGCHATKQVCLVCCDHICRNKTSHYEQGSRIFSLGRTKQILVKHTAKYVFNTYTVTAYRSKEAPGFQISHDHKHCMSILRLDGTSSQIDIMWQCPTPTNSSIDKMFKDEVGLI